MTIQLVRDGQLPVTIGYGAGAFAALAKPEQNVLVAQQQGCGASAFIDNGTLVGNNVGITPQTMEFKTKTKRKLMAGDALYISFKNIRPTAAGTEVWVPTQVQFFVLA